LPSAGKYWNQRVDKERWRENFRERGETREEYEEIKKTKSFDCCAPKIYGNED